MVSQNSPSYKEADMASLSQAEGFQDTYKKQKKIIQLL
jgi:hypothetical protein